MSDTLNRPHLTGEQVVLTGLGQEMHPAFAPFEQKSVAFSGKLPPDQLVSFSNPQCVTHEAPPIGVDVAIVVGFGLVSFLL